MTRRQRNGYTSPTKLANVVRSRWTTFASGTSPHPPLPEARQLKQILETAFYASLEREEGRALRFELCCIKTLPVRRSQAEGVIETLLLAAPRPLTIASLRALAPAVKRDAAAIVVQFSDGAEPMIRGILLNGSSRTRARSGKSYYHDAAPHALLVEVDAPGRIRICQGDIMLAGMDHGRVIEEPLVSATEFTWISTLIRDGVNALFERIEPPRKEDIKEWDTFQWTVLLTTLLSVVASIKDGGHGGTLLLLAPQLPTKVSVRFKYGVDPVGVALSERYIAFINARNRLADKVVALESRGSLKQADSADFLKHEYKTVFAEQRLADMVETVGALGAVDGALVMRSDLRIVGFGAEIMLDTLPQSTVQEVSGDVLRSKAWPHLDDQSFGMRHRSAVRFVASHENTAAFIVSQDGAVSLCWRQEGETYIKRNVKITNANLVG